MTTTPSAGPTPDALWQNLAGALNALVDAGQFPGFHDQYGARNDWNHQPYVTASSYADAPWVVWDLTARQFAVSSRARTHAGEHARARGKRKRG